MYDLRDKVIISVAFALVLLVLIVTSRKSREREQAEFRAAWDTLGETMWKGLGRG